VSQEALKHLLIDISLLTPIEAMLAMMWTLVFWLAI
jgi:hypothetical protein